jgi:hypothetical protein
MPSGTSTSLGVVWAGPRPAPECLTPGREGDEEAAVLVVGGEEVHRHASGRPRPRAQRQRLVELAYAPLACDTGWILAVRRREAETFPQRLSEQFPLAVTGQLQHATPHGNDALVVVADDEPCRRSGVVVLEQLEQEPEAAVRATDRLMGHAVAAVVVDDAFLAVGADEKRHEVSVAWHTDRRPQLPPAPAVKTRR